MQRDTFSRARKILGIRILPRAPTLQTYLFWPIGVNQRRELAQYSSDSRFFWSSCNATCYIFTCAKKKLDPIWLTEIRLLHLLDFLLVVCVSSKGPCCDDDAESIDTASMASAVTSGASGFLLGDDAAEFMRQRGEQT